MRLFWALLHFAVGVAVLEVLVLVLLAALHQAVRDERARRAVRVKTR